jgi:hypothetical protein
MKKIKKNLRIREEDFSGLSREDTPSPVLRKEKMSESLPPVDVYRINRKPVIKSVEVMESKYLHKRIHRGSADGYTRHVFKNINECAEDGLFAGDDLSEKSSEVVASTEAPLYQDIDMVESYDIMPLLDVAAHLERNTIIDGLHSNMGTAKRKLTPPLDERGVKTVRVGRDYKDGNSSLLDLSYLHD